MPSGWLRDATTGKWRRREKSTAGTAADSSNTRGSLDRLTFRRAEVEPTRLRESPVLQGVLSKQGRTVLKRYVRRYFALFGGTEPLLCYFGSRLDPADFRGSYDLTCLASVELHGADIALVFAFGATREMREQLNLRSDTEHDAQRWCDALRAANGAMLQRADARKSSDALAFSRNRSVSTGRARTKSSANMQQSAKASDLGIDLVGVCATAAPALSATTEVGIGESQAENPLRVPDSVEGLKQLLLQHGIPHLRFGRGKNKSVAQLHDELRSGESTLELTPSDGEHGGTLCRVTHVIRAMVRRFEDADRSRDPHVKAAVSAIAASLRSKLVVASSKRPSTAVQVTLPGEAHEKFLVETHQQFADGRVRVRNVLLAEKMKLSEVTDGDIVGAATRGVREELGDSLTGRASERIGRDSDLSSMGVTLGIDSSGRDGHSSPTQVLPRLETLQHATEYMMSPSYPGLRTKYHLHTLVVDVSGLPPNNFHTQEFGDDKRTLKQKHFWKWRTRPQIEQILEAKQRQIQEAEQMALAVPDSTGLSQAAGPMLTSTLDGTADVVITSAVSGSTDVVVESIENFNFLGCEVRARFAAAMFGPTFALHAQQGGIDTKASANQRPPLSLSRDTILRLLRRWHFTTEDEAAILPSTESADVLFGESFHVVVARVLKHVVHVRDGSGSLSDGECTALLSLFIGCGRVELRLLHGGFSGSRVFQAESFSAATGETEESTVIKLDTAEAIEHEHNAMQSITRYLGENACSAMGWHAADNCGAMKIELAGACWCLPDLRGTETPLVTLKDLFMLESESTRQRQYNAMAGMHTLQRTLSEVFNVLFEPTVTQATQPLGRVNLLREYEIERLLFKHVFKRRTLIEKLRKEREAAGAAPEIAHNMLPLEVDDLQRGSKDFFERFHRIIAPLTLERDHDGTRASSGDIIAPQGMVHGDLNGNNILVDTEGIVWLIDFALTGRAHILKDIAKLESCILFEYISEHGDHDDEMAESLLQAVCSVTDLRKPLALPNDLPVHKFDGPFETAWLALCTLRAQVSRFLTSHARLAAQQVEDVSTDVSSSALFSPVPYSIALLCYSLRALSYRDTQQQQKRWALRSAMAHARLIQNAIMSDAGVSTGFRFSSLLAATERDDAWRMAIRGEAALLGEDSQLTGEDYAIELRKYFHHLVISSSYIVDPISRQHINIMEQCVSLKVLEGDDKGDCLRKGREIDAQVEKAMAANRLNALQRSASDQSDHAPRIDEVTDKHEMKHVSAALQKLLPGTDMAEEKLCVLLGAAASGKSVLLKRVMVTSAENFQGSNDSLVPILILLIDLGRLMARRGLNEHDGLIEAYLADRYGGHSDRFRALLRAFRSRQTLLLLDGLDEAGDQKDAIQKYITDTLVPADQRIVVSSRHTGFNDRVFERFNFVQLLPLSRQMQSQVVTMRLRDEPAHHVESVKSELAKVEYAEMAANPLMLSMLISILSHVVKKTQSMSGSLTLSRTKLYQIGVQLMLHQASAAKYQKRRGDEDRLVEHDMKLLRTDVCMCLLKRVAYRTHASRRRDIFSQDMVEAMDDIVRGNLSRSTDLGEEQREQAKLAEVYNALTTCVNHGLVPLLLPLRENYQAQVADQMLRFAHLTFQEYLCAKDIATRLREAYEEGAKKGAQCHVPEDEAVDNFSKHLGRDSMFRVAKDLLTESDGMAGHDSESTVVRSLGRLHSPWWKQVLLFLAAALEELVEDFVHLLLANDDHSGANACLAQTMLTECAPVDSAEISIPDFVRRARDETRAKIEQVRPVALLARGLTHPSIELRNLMLSELRQFSISREKVATELLERLGRSKQRLPWFSQLAAIESLGLLHKPTDAVIEALVTIWTNDPQLQNASVGWPGAKLTWTAAARDEALKALGALGAQNHRLVTTQLVRPLDDLHKLARNECIAVHRRSLHELPIEATRDAVREMARGALRNITALHVTSPEVILRLVHWGMPVNWPPAKHYGRSKTRDRTISDRDREADREAGVPASVKWVIDMQHDTLHTIARVLCVAAERHTQGMDDVLLLQTDVLLKGPVLRRLHERYRSGGVALDPVSEDCNAEGSTSEAADTAAKAMRSLIRQIGENRSPEARAAVARAVLPVVGLQEVVLEALLLAFKKDRAAGSTAPTMDVVLRDMPPPWDRFATITTNESDMATATRMQQLAEESKGVESVLDMEISSSSRTAFTGAPEEKQFPGTRYSMARAVTSSGEDQNSDNAQDSQYSNFSEEEDAASTSTKRDSESESIGDEGKDDEGEGNEGRDDEDADEEHKVEIGLPGDGSRSMTQAKPETGLEKLLRKEMECDPLDKGEITHEGHDIKLRASAAIMRASRLLHYASQHNHSFASVVNEKVSGDNAKSRAEARMAKMRGKGATSENLRLALRVEALRTLLVMPLPLPIADMVNTFDEAEVANDHNVTERFSGVAITTADFAQQLCTETPELLQEGFDYARGLQQRNFLRAVLQCIHRFLPLLQSDAGRYAVQSSGLSEKLWDVASRYLHDSAAEMDTVSGSEADQAESEAAEDRHWAQSTQEMLASALQQHQEHEQAVAMQNGDSFDASLRVYLDGTKLPSACLRTLFRELVCALSMVVPFLLRRIARTLELGTENNHESWLQPGVASASAKPKKEHTRLLTAMRQARLPPGPAFSADILVDAVCGDAEPHYRSGSAEGTDGGETTHCWAFEPLLTHIRAQRQHSPVWELRPISQRRRIEALAQSSAQDRINTKQVDAATVNIEGMLLTKELRIGRFEVEVQRFEEKVDAEAGENAHAAAKVAEADNKEHVKSVLRDVLGFELLTQMELSLPAPVFARGWTARKHKLSTVDGSENQVWDDLLVSPDVMTTGRHQWQVLVRRRGGSDEHRDLSDDALQVSVGVVRIHDEPTANLVHSGPQPLLLRNSAQNAFQRWLLKRSKEKHRKWLGADDRDWCMDLRGLLHHGRSVCDKKWKSRVMKAIPVGDEPRSSCIIALTLDFDDEVPTLSFAVGPASSPELDATNLDEARIQAIRQRVDLGIGFQDTELARVPLSAAVNLVPGSFVEFQSLGRTAWWEWQIQAHASDESLPEHWREYNSITSQQIEEAYLLGAEVYTFAVAEADIDTGHTEFDLAHHSKAKKVLGSPHLTQNTTPYSITFINRSLFDQSHPMQQTNEHTGFQRLVRRRIAPAEVPPNSLCFAVPAGGAATRMSKCIADVTGKLPDAKDGGIWFTIRKQGAGVDKTCGDIIQSGVKKSASMIMRHSNHSMMSLIGSNDSWEVWQLNTSFGGIKSFFDEDLTTHYVISFCRSNVKARVNFPADFREEGRVIMCRGQTVQFSINPNIIMDNDGDKFMPLQAIVVDSAASFRGGSLVMAMHIEQQRKANLEAMLNARAMLQNEHDSVVPIFDDSQEPRVQRPMRLDHNNLKLSTNARKLLLQAEQKAKSCGHTNLAPEHLIWGLLETRPNVILTEAANHLSDLMYQSLADCQWFVHENKALKSVPRPTDSYNRILNFAVELAKGSLCDFVRTEHIIGAMLQIDDIPGGKPLGAAPLLAAGFTQEEFFRLHKISQILREPEAHLSEERKVALRTGPNDRSTWQWQDNSQHWCDFNVQANRCAEEAFAKSQSRYFTASRGTHHGMQSYLIDFRELLQTNVSTGYARKLRRVVQDEVAENLILVSVAFRDLRNAIERMAGTELGLKVVYLDDEDPESLVQAIKYCSGRVKYAVCHASTLTEVALGKLSVLAEGEHWTQPVLDRNRLAGVKLFVWDNALRKRPRSKLMKERAESMKNWGVHNINKPGETLSAFVKSLANDWRQECRDGLVVDDAESVLSKDLSAGETAGKSSRSKLLDEIMSPSSLAEVPATPMKPHCDEVAYTMLDGTMHRALRLNWATGHNFLSSTAAKKSEDVLTLGKALPAQFEVQGRPAPTNLGAAYGGDWETAIRMRDAVCVFYRVAFNSIDTFRSPPIEDGDPDDVQRQKRALVEHSADATVAVRGRVAEGTVVQAFPGLKPVGNFIKVCLSPPVLQRVRVDVGDGETREMDMEREADRIVDHASGVMAWVRLPVSIAEQDHSARVELGRLVPERASCVLPLPKRGWYRPSNYRVRAGIGDASQLNWSPWSKPSDVAHLKRKVVPQLPGKQSKKEERGRSAKGGGESGASLVLDPESVSMLSTSS